MPIQETKLSNTKSLEEVRAKLAEVAKNKDKLGRPLLYNQLPDDPVERKRKISIDSKPMDWDLRSHIRDDMSEEDLNKNMSIILNQAQEQHSNNQINVDQYNNLIKQVFHINEAYKLRQAQIRDKTRINRGSPIHPPMGTPPQIFNENSNGSVDRLVAMDQVKAPAPAPPIMNAWIAQAAQPITPVQPVTLVTKTGLDDLVRTINIDGVPRDIRFYEEIAVVFMNFDDPREIGFEDGIRNLTIDGIQTVQLKFNNPYQPVLVNGQIHHLRLGMYACFNLFSYI